MWYVSMGTWELSVCGLRKTCKNQFFPLWNVEIEQRSQGLGAGSFIN